MITAGDTNGFDPAEIIKATERLKATANIKITE